VGGGAVELAEVAHGDGGAGRPAAARVVRGFASGLRADLGAPFLSESL